MKKIIVILVVTIAFVVAAPNVLAWQEGPGADWWYLDAYYEGWKDNGNPLVIKLNGISTTGQTFYVGDTVDITVDLHSYAGSCAGAGNEAYLEWLLEVDGPSTSASNGDSLYDWSDTCAETDKVMTLTISDYSLGTLGVHTVNMSSYAAVSQYWTDMAEDWANASLTFEVIENVPGDKDECKKGGWETFGSLGFRNQGDCVSYLMSNENAGKTE